MMTYDKYKDSGVEWIGMVPAHWEIRRLKTDTYLKGRIGWNGLRADEFKEESYAYLVTGQDFTGPIIEWSKCYQIDKQRYDEDPFIQLENGDILITKDGTIGKISKVSNMDKPACLNSGVFVMKQKSSNLFTQGYLYWLLSSTLLKEYNQYTSTGTTILHLYQNVFENMPLSIPPLSEQQSIATYLDKKCADIDKVISTQQRRIELLQELKQSTITHAVTHGLDPNVKMKDSGVEWIGMVPEHWEIKRMRFLCKMETGNKDTINKVDDGLYPFFVRSPKIEKINTYSFEGESILMAGDGIGAGKVIHYYNGRFDYHQRVYNFHDYKEIKTKLAYYYIQANFKYIIEEGGAKNTVDSVRLPWLKDFPVCISSQKEQDDILKFIELNYQKYDSSISKAQREIDLLQEYKQSLITEVVTGKRKVC